MFSAPLFLAKGTKGFMFRQKSSVLAPLSLMALAAFLSGAPTVKAQQPPRTPSDTVREFYKAMREKRFRDAWSLTIYKPAVEGLTPEEMEDLRPDFEERATKGPEQVEIINEQVNGKTATVFVK